MFALVHQVVIPEFVEKRWTEPETNVCTPIGSRERIVLDPYRKVTTINDVALFSLFFAIPILFGCGKDVSSLPKQTVRPVKEISFSLDDKTSNR